MYYKIIIIRNMSENNNNNAISEWQMLLSANFFFNPLISFLVS